jgi:hypothetical protein
MHRLFLKPHTTAEWLRSSICWTGSCLAAALVYDRLIYSALLHASRGIADALLLLLGLALHSLIWWRGVVGGDAIIRDDEQNLAFSWVRLGARLWLMALGLFQLLCSGWLLIGLCLLLGDALGPSVPSTTPNEPFFG